MTAPNIHTLYIHTYIPHTHKFVKMTVEGKSKVHPRKGPEGEQRYSSTLSLTMALDGGG